jgi:hypothetical protein
MLSGRQGDVYSVEMNNSPFLARFFPPLSLFLVAFGMVTELDLLR